MEQPIGSKRLVDAFSQTARRGCRAPVLYVFSALLAACSWLNGVALALVPPRGAGYRSKERNAEGEGEAGERRATPG